MLWCKDFTNLARVFVVSYSFLNHINLNMLEHSSVCANKLNTVRYYCSYESLNFNKWKKVFCYIRNIKVKKEQTLSMD